MSVATTILGASGYSGQETLDRVLAHPELELVALGSDSLAGSPASVLDPRLNGSLPAFVTNEEALAAGASSSSAASSTSERRRSSPCRHRRRRPLGRASADGRLALPAWYGFEHPAPTRSATGATRSPSSSRRRGR